VLLSSFYGIASFLPLSYLIAFSTGQGFAGILMNLIRYIVILLFGDAQDDATITKGAIVFFVIAAILILVNIYFLGVIYKDPFFISCVAKSGEFSQDQLREYNVLVEDDKTGLNVNSAEKDSNKESDFNRVVRVIMDLCFLIFLNYILTFIVFPGTAIQGNLFGLSPGLNVTTLMLVFNVFDTIGRYGPNYIKCEKKTVGYIVFSRFTFVMTFTLIAIAGGVKFLGFFSNSFFVIINMALFATTNGFCTSALFTLGPGSVPNDLKGKAGSAMSFFLICGIFSGTLYALFILKNLI